MSKNGESFLDRLYATRWAYVFALGLVVLTTGAAYLVSALVGDSNVAPAITVIALGGAATLISALSTRQSPGR